mgnify:CR=1 FL=1
MTPAPTGILTMPIVGPSARAKLRTTTELVSTTGTAASSCATTPPPAGPAAVTIAHTRVGATIAPDAEILAETLRATRPADPSPPARVRSASTLTPRAGSEPTNAAAPPTPVGFARSSDPTTRPAHHASDTVPVALGGWLELRLYAEVFADAQAARIRFDNQRRRAAIDTIWADAQAARLADIEHQAGLIMRRTYRRVVPASIVAWQKDTRGVGEHLLARLLGTIGHPRIATPHHWEGERAARVLVADAPFERNAAKLWAYCGMGDPARKKRAGMTASDAGAHSVRRRDIDPPSDHPIGILMRASSRTQDGDFRLASPNRLDRRIRLFDGAVGCGSCHSVYSKERSHLVMSNRGSALCLNCHTQ